MQQISCQNCTFQVIKIKLKYFYIIRNYFILFVGDTFCCHMNNVMLKKVYSININAMIAAGPFGYMCYSVVITLLVTIARFYLVGHTLVCSPLKNLDNRLYGNVEAIFHQGLCTTSSTGVQDQPLQGGEVDYPITFPLFNINHMF